MRPTYEKMTIAEMRAFCASLWTICQKSYKANVEIIDYWNDNKHKLPQSFRKKIDLKIKNLDQNKNQLELLGVRDE